MNSIPTLLASDIWSSIDSWISQYRVAWIWCLFQVTLVVTCAAGIYAIVHRRGSNIRFQIMLTSLCFVIGLSLVAFSPWPRWWTIPANHSVGSTPTVTNSIPETTSAVDTKINKTDVASNSEADSSPFNDLAEDANNQSWLTTLAQQLESTRVQSLPASLPATRSNEANLAATTTTSAKANWLAYLSLFVLACIGWGLIRLLVGWIAITRLKARSAQISDPAVLEQLDILCAQLGCNKSVELRETDELVTAATIGWKNATILLPSNWRTWNELEQRAILAHELAHISRNDFSYGCLAQLCLAMHVYHPLVHWLVRRFQLEQELAADAAAALLVGSQRKYTTTLVELALRQPSRPVSWPAQAFLPTRKTFMRRIEVLRDHETLQKSLAALPRMLAVGLLLVAGVAAAGLRNPVQQSEPTANHDEPKQVSPEKPVIQLAAADENVASSAGDETRIDATQQPMVVQYIPQNADRVIALRPKAIMNSTFVSPFLKSLEESFTRGFVPGIKFADMDQLTMAHFRPLGGSSNYLVVCRSNEKRDWITQCQQSTSVDFLRKKLDAKRSCYEIPGLKPSVGHICQIDEQTLIIGDENALLLAAESATSSPALLATGEWKQGLNGELVASIKVASLLAMAQSIPNAPQATASLSSALSMLKDAEHLTFSLGLNDTKIGANLALKYQDATKAKSGHEILNALRVVGLNGFTTSYENLQKLDQGQLPPEVRSHIATQRAAMGLGVDLLKNLSIDVTAQTVQAASKVQVSPELLQTWLEQMASMKKSATANKSRNNMKQILLAMHNFHDVNNAFPPASAQKPNTKARHSWRVAILPFIDGNEIYENYNFNEPWDSDHNKQFLDKMPEAYASPGMDRSQGMTKYLAIVGSNTVITSDQPTGLKGFQGTRMRDITDGTSNTIMLVEANKTVPWTKPEDLSFDTDQPIDKLMKQLPKSFPIGITDGSVHPFTISDEKEARKSLKGAFTRSGDERINIKQLIEPRAASRFPTRRPRRPAGKKSMQNRLKQVGLGLHNFHDVHTALPPASAQKPNTKARHSWRVAILPYIDQQDLYDQYNFDEPWDSEQNKKLLSQMPNVFAAGDDKDAQGLTPILAIVGSDTIITSDQPTSNRGYAGTKFQEVTDGLSNTIAVVESKHRVPWTKPEDISYDKSKPFDSKKWLKADGYNGLFADGSVQPLANPKTKAGIEKLRAWFSRNGGEVIKLNLGN